MVEEIGIITHYFDQVRVAVIKLSGNLKVGDKGMVKGSTTDFSQKIKSIQVNHRDIGYAKNGEDIGLKVIERVRPKDKVFLID